MEHSEWLADFRKQNDELYYRDLDLDRAIRNNLLEVLRRNEYKSIDIQVSIRNGLFRIVSVLIAKQVYISFRTNGGTVLEYNELDRSELLDVYEECIKSLSL